MVVIETLSYHDIMKKIIIIVLIFITIIIWSLFSFDSDDAEFGKEEYRVPETVSLFLRTTYDDEKLPVLELRAFVSGMCDQASDLEVSETTKEGTMFVSINGYSYKEYIGNGDCAAVVIESVAIIEINNFIENRGHQVWFNLNDEDSRYGLGLLQDGNILRLEPIEVTNVISQEYGYNPPETPQPIEIILNEE